jgi:hypothetical protein
LFGSYDTISETVWDLLEIATLILGLILVYAVIGVELFGAALPEEWGSYWNAVMQFFILLTGDNYPDVL